jgi:hypothetical protein
MLCTIRPSVRTSLCNIDRRLILLVEYCNRVRMGWYAAGNDFASLARSRLTLAKYWYRVGRDDTYL